MQKIQNSKEPPVIISRLKCTNLVQMFANALQDSILTRKFKDGGRLPTQETLIRQYIINYPRRI
ncbi:hypothetical protein U27_04579 [Candidatus Vecturithrix granuli]|uniref:Uncharacterized protein n=1 Tax=Vecturithrix granuli TaxID=1499967 RepID=A0A081BZ57_VECG1|nr:hypothetical protein U27_04579 [Candidatus Vecturithrix granuli]